MQGQSKLEGWTRRSNDGSAVEFTSTGSIIVDGMSVVLVRFPLVHTYLEKLRSNQGEQRLQRGVAKTDEGWTMTGFLGLYYKLSYYVILPDEGNEIVRIHASKNNGAG